MDDAKGADPGLRGPGGRGLEPKIKEVMQTVHEAAKALKDKSEQIEESVDQISARSRTS